MNRHLDELHYRVVGILRDGTRDPRYHNLSWETADLARCAMTKVRSYEHVLIEDQRDGRAIPNQRFDANRGG